MKTTKVLGKKILSAITKISPTVSAKLLFFIRTNSWPNLKQPITFNEKTTKLKLGQYSKNTMVTKCADKYSVRRYVEEKGCSEILNKLYGVYDSFDEIDFKKLPSKFVIKCTHGCAYNLIVKNKNELNVKNARKQIMKWQNETYGLVTTELHYTKIKPKIIIEKYLCDKMGHMPIDYKFYCFNGKVECILVCSERDDKLRLSYYDRKWNRLPYEKQSWSSAIDIKKPKKLSLMIKYAEKLSCDFPFVRVDLYNKDGEVIFGELTFTPACCCAPYYSIRGDRELGQKLEIN